jgi:hypothetical protein
MSLRSISTFFFNLQANTGCPAKGETRSELGYSIATDDVARSVFEIGFNFITAVNMKLAAPWNVKKHCFWWWFLGKVGISTRLHRITSRNMKILPFVQFWGLKRVYIRGVSGK